MNQRDPMSGGPPGGDGRAPRVNFNKNHSVWMGDVEPFMTEDYIREQFTQLGLTVVNVRIMHSNKFQEQNLTYAFIELEDERTAIRTVQRYNDKPFPSDSRRKFRLNFTCQSQIKQAQDENGLFVGELSPDVDDLALYSTFQERYPSVKWAKVIKDQNGMSKGFGFVKFNHDEEYNRALTEMNGYQGLGTNALRVSQATPKERKNNNNNNQHQVGAAGQWGGAHHQNPMVAQHQQHMQYFNQATAAAGYPQDYYGYYYTQQAGAAGGYGYGPAGGQANYQQQQQQQYYEQQMRQRHDGRVSAAAGGGMLEYVDMTTGGGAPPTPPSSNGGSGVGGGLQQQQQHYQMQQQQQQQALQFSYMYPPPHHMAGASGTPALFGGSVASTLYGGGINPLSDGVSNGNTVQ